MCVRNVVSNVWERRARRGDDHRVAVAVLPRVVLLVRRVRQRAGRRPRGRRRARARRAPALPPLLLVRRRRQVLLRLVRSLATGGTPLVATHTLLADE